MISEMKKHSDAVSLLNRKLKDTNLDVQCTSTRSMVISESIQRTIQSIKNVKEFISSIPYTLDFLSFLFNVERKDFTMNFGQHSGENNIDITYYKPMGDGPFDVILFDSGLRTGVRELPLIAIWLARMGYVVVGVYSEREVFKDEGKDFVTALSFMRYLPFVSKRAIPIGISSGGAVALRLAADQTAVQLGVVGSIAIDTYYDIRRMHYYAHNYVATHEPDDHRTKVLQRYIDYEKGVTPEKDPEVFANADIIPIIPQIQVPVLLVHGVSDQIVPVEESIDLFTALKQHKKEAYLKLVVGEGVHAPPIDFVFDFIDTIGLIETIAAVKGFLKTLKSKKAD